jgi:hypothetical protein
MTGWKKAELVAPSVCRMTEIFVPLTFATKPVPDHENFTAIGLVASTRPIQRTPSATTPPAPTGASPEVPASLAEASVDPPELEPPPLSPGAGPTSSPPPSLPTSTPPESPAVDASGLAPALFEEPQPVGTAARTAAKETPASV